MRALRTMPEQRPFRFNRQKLNDRQRVYFQCLLQLPALFGRGLAVFAHTEKAAYYGLMLRATDLATVVPGKAAKTYQTELKRLIADQPQAAEHGEACDDDDGIVGMNDAEGLEEWTAEAPPQRDAPAAPTRPTRGYLGVWRGGTNTWQSFPHKHSPPRRQNKYRHKISDFICVSVVAPCFFSCVGMRALLVVSAGSGGEGRNARAVSRATLVSLLRSRAEGGRGAKGGEAKGRGARGHRRAPTRRR